MELRLDKCQFFCTKIEYLRYSVTRESIRSTANGLAAVERFPMPMNVRDVQGFLGLSSYFHKFIENFAVMAKPL